MAAVVGEALLWLFVLNLGIAYGAGLYEKRIVVPLWFGRSGSGELEVHAELMRRTDPGMRFWAFVTTGPLTSLTLANLVVAFGAHGPRHDWWLAAAGITFVERCATFVFFIPAALKLMRSEGLPTAQVEALAARWVSLNYVRDGLTLIGWLTALKALSLPG